MYDIKRYTHIYLLAFIGFLLAEGEHLAWGEKPPAIQKVQKATGNVWQRARTSPYYVDVRNDFGCSCMISKYNKVDCVDFCIPHPRISFSKVIYFWNLLKITSTSHSCGWNTNETKNSLSKHEPKAPSKECLQSLTKIRKIQMFIHALLVWQRCLGVAVHAIFAGGKFVIQIVNTTPPPTKSIISPQCFSSCLQSKVKSCRLFSSCAKEVWVSCKSFSASALIRDLDRFFQQKLLQFKRKL